jgi:hypothetical protein
LLPRSPDRPQAGRGARAIQQSAANGECGFEKRWHGEPWQMPPGTITAEGRRRPLPCHPNYFTTARQLVQTGFFRRSGRAVTPPSSRTGPPRTRRSPRRA